MEGWKKFKITRPSWDSWGLFKIRFYSSPEHTKICSANLYSILSNSPAQYVFVNCSLLIVVSSNS